MTRDIQEFLDQVQIEINNCPRTRGNNKINTYQMWDVLLTHYIVGKDIDATAETYGISRDSVFAIATGRARYKKKVLNKFKEIYKIKTIYDK